MAITTYSELVTAVGNWLHRDDLTSRIPEFIAIGESYLNRKLRIKEMEQGSTIVPSQSVRYVALPTGYMEAISFADNEGEPLIAVDADTLERAAYGIGAQKPEYYRISSRIDFEAIADQAYSFTLRNYKRLDIATDTTNAVLTSHPDCYLYASLFQAAPFIKDQATIGQWQSLMTDAISAANNKSARNLQTLRTEFSGSASNILKG
jgi:hypothetical protein